VDCHWPEAQLPAARRARERNIPVCGDIGVGDQAAELLQHIDYPIYASECARQHGHTGSVEGDLRKLAELGPEVPMITLGKDGCIWLEGGQIHRCPAFSVEAVDTTGCGDVFHGAFTFGLARGWDVARNARFASAVAALKCRALGGRTGIPTYDEVVEFLDRWT
jgi:sugar/nucleoside kinase (ribokinase family)